MFESIISNPLTIEGVLICSLVSLGLGGIIAFVYAFKSEHSKNFVVTLALLPVIVQAIIMMVNGNIGTGVAVAGAFGLIRFRTVPGNSRDITCVFLGTAVGIATGIGQIWFAMLLAGVAIIIFIAFKFFPNAKKDLSSSYPKELRITVAEDLDYETEVEGLLKEMTKSYEMIRVKTTNMGSLYTIDYKITLKKDVSTKQLIDELRIKNSNLPIAISKYKAIDDSL